MIQFPRRNRLWAGAAIIVLMSTFGTACADDTPASPSVLTCPAQPTAPLAVAIGARANSAVPALPEELGTLLTDVAKAEKQITLIRLDGEPDPAFRDTFHFTTQNGPSQDRELAAFLGTVKDAFAGPARAEVPEADVLSALSVASRTTSGGGTIVVLDSGLQTTAPLDFRRNDLILAEPQDVVDFLRKADLVPDLAGRHVVLVGFGETAKPQAVLDDRLRRNLTSIWRAIAEAGGACVDDVAVGASMKASVSDVPPVGLVPLPAPPEPPGPDKRCAELVLSEHNNVGFEKNVTVFRNEPAARTEIGTVADLVRNDVQKVELVGTTARHGTKESQIDLAGQRAERVKEIMVESGIAVNRITTSGVGSYSQYYIPDGGPDTLDPGPAAQNRRVIVRLICPPQ